VGDLPLLSSTGWICRTIPAPGACGTDACVGGNSKAPIGVVSFAQNLFMAAMGAAMPAGSKTALRLGLGRW